MMRKILSGHRLRRALAVTAVAGCVALTAGLTAAAGSTGGAGTQPGVASTFAFSLVPSAGITACLSHARGSVTITPGPPNDTMTISASGLPHNTSFDLFVIQVPNKPFGVALIRADLHAGASGTVRVTVKGVVNIETSAVSAGGTVTFSPANQYHLGIGFNNPKT